jgi:hypothetical protein
VRGVGGYKQGTTNVVKQAFSCSARANSQASLVLHRLGDGGSLRSVFEIRRGCFPESVTFTERFQLTTLSVSDYACGRVKRLCTIPP